MNLNERVLIQYFNQSYYRSILSACSHIISNSNVTDVNTKRNMFYTCYEKSVEAIELIHPKSIEESGKNIEKYNEMIKERNNSNKV